MYKEYFAIKEKPFSIAPDPRFLYMSDGHREAMAHLVYGIRNEGGFVLLTGEVGAGKTTVCRCLFEQIPEGTNIAFILNPRLTVPEMLATFCDELHIPYPAGTASIKIFVDAINSFLLREHGLGRRTVLIIDEAQNLGVEVLEQIRLLTNLETNQCKLLQIIMLGQPELRELLARPELRQLAQRITARHHLGPLSRSETESYIQHRLSVVGLEGKIFSPAAIEKVYKVSGGIPRLINTLCDRGMLGAYAKGQRQVDKETMAHAVVEIMGEEGGGGAAIRPPVWAKIGLAALALVLLAGGLRYYPPPLFFLPPRPEKIAAAPGAVVVPTVGPEIKEVPVVAAAPFPEAPAVEPGLPPGEADWPQGRQAVASERLAYAALLQQWSSPAEFAGDNPCRSAAQHGLACFGRQESFASLRRLNRPAVLTMHNEGNEPFYALLTVVGGETATLRLGKREVVIKQTELARYWSGRYLLLWRTPPGYRESILPGHKGAVVKWMSGQFARLDGQAPDSATAAKDILDESVIARVREFQLAHDLIPDGLVGARTLILLAALADNSGPFLSPRQ